MSAGSSGGALDEGTVWGTGGGWVGDGGGGPGELPVDTPGVKKRHLCWPATIPRIPGCLVIQPLAYMEDNLKNKLQETTEQEKTNK